MAVSGAVSIGMRNVVLADLRQPQHGHEIPRLWKDSETLCRQSLPSGLHIL